MLSQVILKNFVLIDKLVLDLKTGMTVITGETGAGKSIMIDAISLALGQRASSNVVKADCDRADICLNFEIASQASILEWLSAENLDASDDCIVRRTISKDGRSKCYINDNPTTLQKLKELGEHLINIHGQHEHQALFHKDKQRDLLDAFAQQKPLAKKVKGLFNQWRNAQKEFDTLREKSSESTQRIEFLNYQLTELKELGLTENEVEALEKEHKRLANASDIIEACNSVILSSSEDESATLNTLNKSCKALGNYVEFDSKIKNALDLFNSAVIQTQEAVDEINNFLGQFDSDPNRLATVETRLNKIYDIARKHHIKANELAGLEKKLSAELQALTNYDETLQTLEQQAKEFASLYETLAQQLSEKRKIAAKKLEKQVTQNLTQLGMPKASFHIALEALETFNASGLEKINFLIAANPGQKPQPLNQIASGGELSRVSLAIQVITAEQYVTPTLIFDEVDVGIGGAVAEVVGDLLRKLSQNAQVLTITHLGQVAGKGDQHLQVSKGNKHKTQVLELSEKERIQEIARMIGGKKSQTKPLHMRKRC